MGHINTYSLSKLWRFLLAQIKRITEVNNNRELFQVVKLINIQTRENGERPIEVYIRWELEVVGEFALLERRHEVILDHSLSVQIRDGETTVVIAKNWCGDRYPGVVAAL